MPTARGVLKHLLIRNTRVDSEETCVRVFSQAVHQSPNNDVLPMWIYNRLTIRVVSWHSITRPYQPSQSVA